MKKAIFAWVASPRRAESVVSELRLAGFSRNDVSVLFPDMERPQAFSGRETPHGVVPASARRVLGGLTDWLVGMGCLVIFGAGPLIAAGPLFASVGTTADGLKGSLVGLGVTEREAKSYAGKLEDGNILIATHAKNSDEVQVARDIFERADAQDIGISTEESIRS